MRRIVVGYDGSEAAGRALDRAGELAKAFDCPLVVLTAAADRLFDERGVLLPTLDDTRGRRTAEIGVERARALGVSEVVARVSVEAPDDALVSAAHEEKCDLMVVGHHSVGPLHELLLGSTAKSVVDRAPCSVLVVR